MYFNLLWLLMTKEKVVGDFLSLMRSKPARTLGQTLCVGLLVGCSFGVGIGTYAVDSKGRLRMPTKKKPSPAPDWSKTHPAYRPGSARLA